MERLVFILFLVIAKIVNQYEKTPNPLNPSILNRCGHHLHFGAQKRRRRILMGRLRACFFAERA